MASQVLHLDLETYSEVDLRSEGLYNYVQSPTFEILLLSFAWGDGEPQVIDLARGEEVPADIIQALNDPSVIKQAHNAAFEIACLSKFWTTEPSQWRCSQVQAYYCRYPGSLEKLGEALGLSQEQAKLRTGKALIRYFCVPCAPTKSNGGRTRNLPRHDLEKWELFKEYGAQDVKAEQAVCRALSAWPLPEEEHQNWVLDQKINDRGVGIDLDLVQAVQKMDIEIREKLSAEATALSGLENPNSVTQLKKWLEEATGNEVESLNKSALRDLIEDADNDTVARMLTIRQQLGKSSVKKYDAMALVAGEDKRARGLLQFYGAGTGRWAGRLVQVQNLPRNYVEPLGLAREFAKEGRADALALVFGEDVQDTLSQLVRTAFVPREGNRFIVADFSAIEARVIAWLAGERWRQEVFATTGKIYEASASMMFGVPVERIKKGNPDYDLRQKGKVAELALGYGGGKGSLISMGALRMGLEADELLDIVQRWRKASPRIVELWYALERCAVECVRTCLPQHTHGLIFRMTCGEAGQALAVELPSGRCLHYPKPFLVQGAYGKEELRFYSVGLTKKWEATKTYGGKLTENIIQAIARDCLAVTLRRLDALGYETVMHIHDEVVLDVPKDFGSLEEVCAVMAQPIEWADGLMLKGAGFEADYYQKD